MKTGPIRHKYAMKMINNPKLLWIIIFNLFVFCVFKPIVNKEIFLTLMILINLLVLAIIIVGLYFTARKMIEYRNLSLFDIIIFNDTGFNIFLFVSVFFGSMWCLGITLREGFETLVLYFKLIPGIYIQMLCLYIAAYTLPQIIFWPLIKLKILKWLNTEERELYKQEYEKELFS